MIVICPENMILEQHTWAIRRRSFLHCKDSQLVESTSFISRRNVDPQVINQIRFELETKQKVNQNSLRKYQFFMDCKT